MTATVAVETSSRKFHGFSIDALIGTNDDARKTDTRTPPSPPPRVEKSLSPETENRVAAWGEEGFKHLFPGYSSPVEVAASLYQPLRVCNRAISAGSSAFLPPHLTGLPFSPLLYGLGREFTHHSPHPILTPRYPGFVHPRYHMGPPPGLLFHPYRKPKRNRTAFSPSQLLQLEQAFEKNHYVVGQERKQLAAKLQLSETQVKVWFQNRRTKHKRMKAEEEAGEKTGEDSEKKSGEKREDISTCDPEHGSDVSEMEEDRSSDVEHDEEDEEEDEEEELCVTDQGDS